MLRTTRLVPLLLLLAGAPALHAATINVPASDEAALIAAIDTANGNGEDDTIVLAASTYTFTAANNPLNALPVVTTRITIQGNDAVVERQGAPEFRLFEVGGSGDLKTSACCAGDAVPASGECGAGTCGWSALQEAARRSLEESGSLSPSGTVGLPCMLPQPEWASAWSRSRPSMGGRCATCRS